MASAETDALRMSRLGMKKLSGGNIIAIQCSQLTISAQEAVVVLNGVPGITDAIAQGGKLTVRYGACRLGRVKRNIYDRLGAYLPSVATDRSM